MHVAMAERTRKVRVRNEISAGGRHGQQRLDADSRFKTSGDRGAAFDSLQATAAYTPTSPNLWFRSQNSLSDCFL